ncbi:MAG: hypothetical protein ACI8ZW_002459, partial [Yoonia sp.]
GDTPATSSTIYQSDTKPGGIKRAVKKTQGHGI